MLLEVPEVAPVVLELLLELPSLFKGLQSYGFPLNSPKSTLEPIFFVFLDRGQY